MKCPKCRYTSFPHLEKCPKCGIGLAEQRAALGIYALRPDPPDLLLAYQAASMDITGAMLTSPVYAPDIDLGPLEGVDLEIAEAEPDEAGTHKMEEPANAAPDSMPTLEREVIEEEEFAPEEPGSERLSSQDVIIPQSLDLSELGDIALALENAADLGGESPESAQTPRELADVKQVYDLDVDEDLDGLTLGHILDDAGADDEDDKAAEYTLEIEEDLEFEVDGLELEQDDEGEDEDDDDR
jgi:hypothetical protein